MVEAVLKDLSNQRSTSEFSIAQKHCIIGYWLNDIIETVRIYASVKHILRVISNYKHYGSSFSPARSDIRFIVARVPRPYYFRPNALFPLGNEEGCKNYS